MILYDDFIVLTTEKAKSLSEISESFEIVLVSGFHNISL